MDCCEHGDELLLSIKCGKFVDCLPKCWFHMNDSALWVSFLFDWLVGWLAIQTVKCPASS
jgi:hypothetical protein